MDPTEIPNKSLTYSQHIPNWVVIRVAVGMAGPNELFEIVHNDARVRVRQTKEK